ncbi:hypothetical protein M8C21_028826, partial [Ambrosia artemisiifolia]
CIKFKQNLSSINSSIDDTYYSPCADWLGSGYKPIMMNWNTNTDCCVWNGVTCDHSTGDVIGLDLSCAMLYVLPTNFNISSSSSLKLLNLGSTGLQGNLPHNIFSLQSLETLDLSGNSLTGHIPSEISLLPKLVSLDLSDNGIDNLVIQPHIFRTLLTNSTILRDLWLSKVNIGLVLPTYLNISSSLRSLHLSSTNLQGKLPHNIFDLEYLEVLELSWNSNLSGPLPSVNTSRSIPLRGLALSGTSLSGEIPTSIGHLKSLDLKVFPVFIRAMTYLRHLDLSNNDMQGHIPDWIRELGRIQLSVLDLSNNSLTGTIPNVFEDWSWLEGFGLNGNQLEGKVPTSLNKCRYLRVLVLKSNNFHGGIVTSSKVEFPFQSLQVLDLSHNGFVGQLPTNYFQNFNAMKNVKPQLEGDGNGEEENGFTWKVVVMGYGCGALLGLVSGYLMLSTGRPKLFNSIVDEVKNFGV